MPEKKYVIDNPVLMSEWDWEKNNELQLDPKKLTLGSGKRVWWKCGNGHEWENAIYSRNSGRGCPYCSGRYAIKGENDLQTVNPKLAKEWDYEKNSGLTPADVLPNSDKNVWWKCKKGHRWRSRISSRNKGCGCPKCHSERHTSFPEYALLYYFKKYGVDAIHSYKEKGYELDIYIPSKKIAIEYDGGYWHKNKSKLDLGKNLKCKKDGIKLYRIREELPSLNDTSIDFVIQNNRKDLSKIIEEILCEIIETSVDVDLKRDGIFIENLQEYTEKERSLIFSHPELIKEWDYQKNGKLKPEYFTANSGRKVGWICSQSEKHQWVAQIANRTNGSGCPFCAGQRVLVGDNDLATINPDLVEEWDYEKNGELKPEDFTANSGKKVWWKCVKGHPSWLTTIGDRNKGSKCPVCVGQALLSGYNDLATINPDLAKEWDYEKNGDLKPENVAPNSKEKVWWKCSKGHPSWEAVVYSRNSGRGCPYCSGRYAIKGVTDLLTLNPNLAKEWDYEKNGDLKPEKVAIKSNKKVWWKCSKGHPSWKSTIASRSDGVGCPYCSNKKVLPGFNDLATINPKLAKEWDYEENGNLQPKHFTANSRKKVGWKCGEGHKWRARIDHRNNGSGCPVCSGHKVLSGYNDLATINPNLVKEWDYEKNGDLKPENVAPNSKEKAWWKCSKGHPSWKARIAHRNNGSGCPKCSKRRKLNKQ